MPTIDMSREIEARIRSAVADCEVSAKMNGDRHYSITVKSASFAGLTMLQCHRQVLGAIKQLMDGDDAQVHAIDSLKTSA
ncbi:MAG: BolA/IbaG family iron-sulfur metabolism protein [Polyangiales bacterium]